MYRIFGRDPAVILNLVAVLVSLAGAYYFHFSGDVETALNAVALALVGVLTAWSVKREKLFAFLAGLVKAAMVLAVTLGLDLPVDKQAMILTLVAAIGAVVVRDRVTAKVPSGELESV